MRSDRSGHFSLYTQNHNGTQCVNRHLDALVAAADAYERKSTGVKLITDGALERLKKRADIPWARTERVLL